MWIRISMSAHCPVTIGRGIGQSGPPPGDRPLQVSLTSRPLFGRRQKEKRVEPPLNGHGELLLPGQHPLVMPQHPWPPPDLHHHHHHFPHVSLANYMA